MKRLAACALVFFSLSGCLFFFRDKSAAGWESVGSGGLEGIVAASFSPAVDADGTPYVAHTGGEFAFPEALVSRFVDGEWSDLPPPLGDSSSGTVLRLLTGSDGELVACGASSSLPMVRLYDGSIWTDAADLPVYPPESWSPYGPPVEAALAPDGAIHLVMPDYGCEGRLTVLKLEGASWSAVGDRGFADFSATTACLAWSSGAELYLASESTTVTGQSPVVFRYNSAVWSSVGADSMPSDAHLGTLHGTNTQALAFDAAGRPCVAVLTWVGSALTPAVLAFDGSAWVAVGDGAVVASNSLSVALARGPDGLLYAAVVSEVYRQELAVFRLSAGAWEPVGTPGFTAANHAEEPQLAFGPDGAIYVAYVATGADYEIQVMRHPGFGSGDP